MTDRRVFGRWVLMAVILVVTVSAVQAAPALGADAVFWSDYGNSTIGFAALDNTGGGQLDTTGATPSRPWGVAIDPATNMIYWADYDGNTISYASLNGGGGQLNTTGAPAPSSPNGVAIDPTDNKIYWVNDGDGKIGYANLDNTGGGGQLSTTGATITEPYGLAVDPALNKVYVANFNTQTISYANLDNTGGGGQLNTTGATLDGPDGVAIDPAANKLYTANYDNGTISYVNLDDTGGGGQLNTTGATLSDPIAVALLKAPSGTAVPTISGGGTFGSLSCSSGTWASDFLGGFLYQSPESLTYGWTLNGSPIAGATSSTIDASSAGQYTCTVTAVNHAGSATQASAPHSISAPPRKLSTKITKAKINGKRHTAKFAFKATGATGFQCALIKKPMKGKKRKKPHFSRCSSPKTYKHLKAAKYTFEVRALNAAGAGKPATKSFKIGSKS